MASRIETIQGETSPILTTFAEGFVSPARLIAPMVAPVIRSMTETGTLYIFGKEGFMLYDTERALRAAAKKFDYFLSKDTYVCKEHALETSLDYKELEAAQKYGAQAVLRLEQRSINVVQQALAIELEKAVADYVFSGTYYATGNKATLTGTDQWQVSGGGAGSTSTPIEDIVKTGAQAARADMGVYPNTVVFGATAWKAFREHPDVVERVRYTSPVGNPSVISMAQAAQLLDVENVYVGNAVYSTDAGVFTDIWGDSVAMIYVPPADMMVEGTTPHTIIVEEEGYPEVRVYDSKKTRDYEVTRKYVVKNLDTSYGYLILDTVA